VIVGDGPILQEIPDRGNIIKCGVVGYTKIPEFINIADVCVFPVSEDCSPIVISEYLAVGKPIVMPKGRMDWLLIDGESGYLVDNNIHSWKRGIDQAIKIKNSTTTHNLNLAKQLSWQKLGSTYENFIIKTV